MHEYRKVYPSKIFLIEELFAESYMLGTPTNQTDTQIEPYEVSMKT